MGKQSGGDKPSVRMCCLSLCIHLCSFFRSCFSLIFSGKLFQPTQPYLLQDLLAYFFLFVALIKGYGNIFICVIILSMSFTPTAFVPCKWGFSQFLFFIVFLELSPRMLQSWDMMGFKKNDQMNDVVVNRARGIIFNFRKKLTIVNHANLELRHLE